MYIYIYIYIYLQVTELHATVSTIPSSQATRCLLWALLSHSRSTCYLLILDGDGGMVSDLSSFSFCAVISVKCLTSSWCAVLSSSYCVLIGCFMSVVVIVSIPPQMFLMAKCHHTFLGLPHLFFGYSFNFKFVVFIVSFGLRSCSSSPFL